MLHLARALALALVSSLLVLGFGVVSPAGASEATPETHPEWGATFAKNGRLRRGCRTYHYGYKITPPKGDWQFETFIVGPGGVALASNTFQINMDVLADDKVPYRICKPSTRAGVFKIRAKLSSMDGDELTEGWLPVTRFRLRNPR
ncbi:hypothetical protein [Nocardioides dilutus]